MTTDQIQKQLDWLDEERRKEKAHLTSLEDRLKSLESAVNPIISQMKDLSGDITRLTTLFSRMDNLDQGLLQVRLDQKQTFEEMDKLARKREDDLDKLRRAELRSLEAALARVNKELEQLNELKRSMKARQEEETRLTKAMEDLRLQMDALRNEAMEDTHTIRQMDESRRQDSKRLIDVQGEVNALRKRADEQLGKIDLNAASLKKVETRVNEYAALEVERREAVSNFLNSQALRDVEREKTWRTWQTRFQTIESQAADFERFLQDVDNTQRTVKRSQQAVDELTQKLERRFAEISEVQRLTEERFRQDWVTFRADDQKRWTNYTISSDEQRNEFLRQFNKSVDKVTDLEDKMQETQDLLQMMNELTKKAIEGMASLAHEMGDTFEKTIER